MLNAYLMERCCAIVQMFELEYCTDEMNRVTHGPGAAEILSNIDMVRAAPRPYSMMPTRLSHSPLVPLTGLLTACACATFRN